MLPNTTAIKLDNVFENLTGAIKQIDNDQHYIHSGKFFTAFSLVTITSGSTLKYTLVTPATGTIHYRPANITSSADQLTINLYEGSTGNSGGTAITPTNRNRNSSTATVILLKSGVTVTTNGTIIQKAYIPGATGTGGTRSGASLSGINEWVLKPSTVYTFEFINGSSASNVVFTEFQWYEE